MHIAYELFVIFATLYSLRMRHYLLYNTVQCVIINSTHIPHDITIQGTI